jgi:hypothetical protein
VAASDASLRATSGVAALGVFIDKLDVVGTFDRGFGPVKKRDRVATAGELLVALAQSQLLGGDALVELDRQRHDVAAVELSAVPPIPATATAAGGLARRFGAAHLAGFETANAEVIARTHPLLPGERRAKLETALTIDMDSTDVEVYCSRKRGVAYNYAGQGAPTWRPGLKPP